MTLTLFRSSLLPAAMPVPSLLAAGHLTGRAQTLPVDFPFGFAQRLERGVERRRADRRHLKPHGWLTAQLLARGSVAVCGNVAEVLP